MKTLMPTGKSLITGLLFSGLLVIACNSEKKDLKIEDQLVVERQAAEFEPQRSVWLIWPPTDHKATLSNASVVIEILEKLTPHTPVNLTFSNDSLVKNALEMMVARDIDTSNVDISVLPSEEFWTRDMGPNFVELEDGRKAIVDFDFNAWGYTPADSPDAYTIRMEQFDSLIARKLDLPIIKSDLISEGGNREVNGKGVLMLSEVVEKGRNPEWSREQMEHEFQRVLGVDDVIWLKEGLLEDRHTFLGPLTLEDGSNAYTVVTTNGHTDEFARFVNDSTIMLASVKEEDLEDPIAAENKKRMDENLKILQASKDQDGKPFHIIRMPLPKTVVTSMKPGDPVYDYIETLEFTDGSSFPKGETVQVVAAASYLNFLITDKVIIGQKYYREGMDLSVRERDREADSILRSAFPDREIIMIDALPVNLGGGGIHCISMHEPQ
ncbi:agmatine deiminase family protein [Robertkochia aurantiaca]|uniref:agmatine deiminase family protein n=1 Tax=Robertkochia aurantiaca TaxID=2873700 RepID=UPI001CCBB234|nr:agmatine deiminase family protein [Robertkochia sp. 3YJGBD-33]